MTYEEMMLNVAKKYGLENKKTIRFCNKVESGADPLYIDTMYADLMGE